MTSDNIPVVEASYRTLYGKIFSALFRQFGTDYVNEIEDAIQNSFYKSLKSWKPGQVPHDKESWFFIVARNDVLNQIKRGRRALPDAPADVWEDAEPPNEDARLKTMLFLSKSNIVSSKAKVIFMLKNIFGLHIKEISACTLLSQEAIYKSIIRAKQDFQETVKDIDFELTFEQVTAAEILIVEEILYAVFNIGFDSFNEKIDAIINEDLCLEALALTKVLSAKFELTTTSNLLALFCFHLARIPAKFKDEKFIPFFKQDKNHWDQDFIQLGFHYLQKPVSLNKYYLEALIVSKHMTTTDPGMGHWSEIIQLYQLLLSLYNSPIMKLNLCYCLCQAHRTEEAKALFEIVENELPHEHIYLSLVRANLFDDKDTLAPEQAIGQVLKNITQKMRRTYILENMTTGF